MKIPRPLPQFFGKTIFVVVAATERAVIYAARDGEIEPIHTVDERKGRYSDREGFFMRLGAGLLYGAGSGYTGQNKEVHRRFERHLQRDLTKLAERAKPTRVFLFEPEHNKKLEVVLSKIPKLMVLSVRHGNYVQDHPLELLAHIAALRQHRQTLSDEHSDGDVRAREKEKILERADAARRIIRGT